MWHQVITRLWFSRTRMTTTWRRMTRTTTMTTTKRRTRGQTKRWRETTTPNCLRVDTILYRDGQQPPLPPSPQSQPPPPPLQTAFAPIQPLPEYNPADYPGSTSPELQRVLVGQHMLGPAAAGPAAGRPRCWHAGPASARRTHGGHACPDAHRHA